MIKVSCLRKSPRKPVHEDPGRIRKVHDQVTDDVQNQAVWNEEAFIHVGPDGFSRVGIFAERLPEKITRGNVPKAQPPV